MVAVTAGCAPRTEVINTHKRTYPPTHLVLNTSFTPHIADHPLHIQQPPSLSIMSAPQRGRGQGPPQGPFGKYRDVPSPVPSSSSTRGGFGRQVGGQNPSPGSGPGYRGGPHLGGGMRGGRGGRGGPPSHAGGPGRIFMGNVPAHVDDRLSTSDALIQSFKGEHYNPEKPLRPGWGTKGRPITLRANFFPITFPEGLSLYEYTIAVTPDKLPYPSPPEPKASQVEKKDRGKKSKRGDNKLKSEEFARILELLEETDAFKPHLSYVAHDKGKGRILTSTKLLPQPLEIQVPWCYEGETTHRSDTPVYTVKIVFNKPLTTTELERYVFVIQASPFVPHHPI